MNINIIFKLLVREANICDWLEILTSDAFTTMIIHTLTVGLSNCAAVGRGS